MNEPIPCGCHGVDNCPARGPARTVARLMADTAKIDQLERRPVPVYYAVRNNEGYWRGIWNDRAIAETIAASGQPSHGEQVVELVERAP